MIDLKELKNFASIHLENHGPHKMPILNTTVLELIDRLEKAEKKIKKYGKGSEALCRAFGVK